MVQIGGDRATSADYQRANKQARLRARPSSKSSKSSKSSGSKSKVLGSRTWNPRPAPRSAPSQQARAAPAPAPTQRSQPRPPMRWGPLAGGGQGPVQYSPPPDTKPYVPPASNVRGRPQPTALPSRDPNAPNNQRGRPQPPPALRDPNAPNNQRGRGAQGAPEPAAPILPLATPQQASRQALAANPNPGPPPPELSDDVRRMLNEQGWKLPEEPKAVKMAKSDLEGGKVKDLTDFTYEISDKEWARMQELYSSPAALKAGYIPPAPTEEKKAPVVKVDEEQAPLTYEAYQALNKDQRAAVDFNTLLVEAREADLQNKGEVPTMERDKYNRQLEEIFGKEGGSTTYAPRTVDFLSKLDMDMVGQDIDEYLSLERAIDEKELKDFKISKKDARTLNSLTNGVQIPMMPNEAQQYASVRSEQNLQQLDSAAVENTRRVIRDALQQDNAMAYSFDTLMNGVEAAPGGVAPVGFGGADTQWANQNDAMANQWFQERLSLLAAEDPYEVAKGLGLGIPKGGDVMGFVLGELDDITGGEGTTRQDFLDYLSNTALLVDQYGSKDDRIMAERLSKRAGLGG